MIDSFESIKKNLISYVTMITEWVHACFLHFNNDAHKSCSWRIFYMNLLYDPSIYSRQLGKIHIQMKQLTCT